MEGSRHADHQVFIIFLDLDTAASEQPGGLHATGENGQCECITFPTLDKQENFVAPARGSTPVAGQVRPPSRPIDRFSVEFDPVPELNGEAVYGTRGGP